MIDIRWEYLISYLKSLWSNRLAKNILIRGVPESIGSWLKRQALQNMTSQKEILLSILKEAKKVGPLDLFKLRNENETSYICNHLFTFVDLFAGIGGFRIGLEKVGGHCIFSCEWDKHAQKTYLNWFGEKPYGDIKDLDPNTIPDHDILAAGFPCQPFSIAGVSKKNSLGREHGFKDKTQGTLFFYLANIISIKRPPIVILENVKNLVSHDKGQTWQVIKNTLYELNYHVFSKIIDASDYVPQHRERIFILCFDKNVFKVKPPFDYPEKPTSKTPKVSDILEINPDQKYTLSNHLWSYLKNYAKMHREKGNGFGYGLADLNGITRTLSARYYKDGSEILIPQDKNKNPRRLTPKEAARLMGFDDNYEISVSDTQAYKQFGNAVVPPVVEAIGRQLVKILIWYLTYNSNGCLIKGR